MKTPDEIKKGLEHGISDCKAVKSCKDECPYEKSCWPYAGGTSNASIPTNMLQDALAYIQQLEAELADAERNHQHTIGIAERQKEQIDKLKNVIVRLNKEQNAALSEMHGMCGFCKHNGTMVCVICKYKNHWEWRGVKED